MARGEHARRRRDEPTRGSPCSTSTTTATSTWCSPPSKHRRSRCSTTAWAEFHEVAIQVSPMPPDQSPASWRPTSIRTAAPTWSPQSSSGRVVGLAQHDGADHGGQRPSRPSSRGRSTRPTGAERRRSTSTSTACPICSDCRPPRTSRAKCSCPRGPATRGLASRRKPCP